MRTPYERLVLREPASEPGAAVSPSSRPLRMVVVAVLAATFWVSVPGDVLYGSSRPEPAVVPPGATRWPPPVMLTTPDAAPMLHRWSELPLRVPGAEPVLEFHVEREAVDLHGIEAFERAAARWSEVRGSRLRVAIAGVVDDGVDRNRYDGRNRIFINRRSCDRPMLGLAHVRAGATDERAGTPVAHVDEVNIGLCPHLSPQRLDAVLLHEIGHAVGFGHLCDPQDHHGCWTPEMHDANRCRVMYAAVTDCQTWDDADERAVVSAYPVAPTIAGADRVQTSARMVHTAFVRPWRAGTVVIVDADADEPQRWSAVAAAGALRAPLLIAPRAVSSCTRGEFAQELGRVASFGAELLLVGRSAIACGPQVESWQLRGRVLRGPLEIVEAVLERLPSPTEVVVAGLTEKGEVPGGAVAAALAGARRAPLLVAAGFPLNEDQRRVLRERSSIRSALVIGDARYPRAPVAAELRRDLGIEVHRMTGASDGSLSAQAAALQPSGTALVAASGTVDAMLAAAYAPTLQGPVVLVDPPRMGAAAVRILVDRAERAFIVGRSLPEGDDLRVSRWLDRR